jgi:hypothetical protein
MVGIFDPACETLREDQICTIHLPTPYSRNKTKIIFVLR